MPLLRPQQGRLLLPPERGRRLRPQPQPLQRAPSCYSSFLRAWAAGQDRRFGGSPRLHSGGERREERDVAEADSEAAKDSRQKQAAEAGSTALASWLMLGYAQCPVLQGACGASLIAEFSFAVDRITCS